MGQTAVPTEMYDVLKQQRALGRTGTDRERRLMYEAHLNSQAAKRNESRVISANIKHQDRTYELEKERTELMEDQMDAQADSDRVRGAVELGSLAIRGGKDLGFWGKEKAVEGVAGVATNVAPLATNVASNVGPLISATEVAASEAISGLTQLGSGTGQLLAEGTPALFETGAAVASETAPSIAENAIGGGGGSPGLLGIAGIAHTAANLGMMVPIGSGETTRQIKSTVSGGIAGAIAGSVIPVIGTVIGAAVGYLIGDDDK